MQPRILVKQNAAIAQDMITKQKKIIVEPVADKPEAPRAATQAQSRVWVETTSRKVQTLVTTSRTSVAKSSLLHPSITRVAKAAATAEPVANQAPRPGRATSTGAPVIEPAVHYRDVRPTPNRPARGAASGALVIEPAVHYRDVRPTPNRPARATASGALVIEPTVHYRDLQTAATDRSAPGQPMPLAGSAFAIQAPATSPASASRAVMVARSAVTDAAPSAVRQSLPTVQAVAPRASGEIKLAAREADMPTANPTDNVAPTDMIAAAATETTTDTLDAASTYRRTRYEVSNGAGRRRMATRMRYFLASQGIAPYYITNAEHYSNHTSTILYRTGYLTDARKLAAKLPIPVEFVEVDSQRADVRLRLGGDLLEFDREIIVLSRKDLS